MNLFLGILLIILAFFGGMVAYNHALLLEQQHDTPCCWH